jgi:hypothetical protein
MGLGTWFREKLRPGATGRSKSDSSGLDPEEELLQ